MNHARTKLIAATVVLVLAAGYLVFAGVQKGWVYFVEVDQFVNDQQYRHQRVRLVGTVDMEQASIRNADLIAEFKLNGAAEGVPVVYKGVIPEMFRPGAQVVVEGKLNDKGVFEATVLMTKCASKYEGAEGPDSAAAPPSGHPAMKDGKRVAAPKPAADEESPY